MPAPGQQQQMTIQQALEIGLQHHHAKRYHDAEIIYRQILSQYPNNPDALHLLGLIAHIHNRNDVALDLVGRATQLSPMVAPFWNTLGEVNRVMGRLDSAYHCYQKALRYHPDMPEALNNLGILYAYRNEIDNSIKSFERAIELRPDYPEAHDGLGLTLLLAGQLRRGWTEQEWRWKKDILAHARRHFKEPLWAGEDVKGKRFLIHAEQGFGDVIQFCRYVPMVKALGAHVIFEVPPELEPLMRTLVGYDELVIKPGPGNGHLPPFDLQCPLMSLPLVMGTDFHNIPSHTPYIYATPEKTAYWKERVEAAGPGLKVGISWAGRPSHPRDAGRSMPLSNFVPFASIPGVKLISFQKGDALSQIEQNPPGTIAANLGPDIKDFSDSAGIIANLDLVLAVDTSLVHLAGALDKPFFVLLPFSPDWRWLLNRSDNPWYKTGRLFRQKIDQVWTHPIEEAKAALEELAASKSAS
jgi:Tfp pilus assembly protein PilF